MNASTLRRRLVGPIVAGALGLSLGVGLAIAQEGAGQPQQPQERTGWEKFKEDVGEVFSPGFDVSVIEGHVVNLGDCIVLSDEQRTQLGDKALFSGAPLGIRTERGGLYLVFTDHFKDVQLDRLGMTGQAKEEAAAEGQNPNAEALELEQKLTEALTKARTKLDAAYEAEVKTWKDAKMGDRVAIIGRAYDTGGMQAILADTIHADRDGLPTQAMTE